MADRPYRDRVAGTVGVLQALPQGCDVYSKLLVWISVRCRMGARFS